MSLEGKIIDFHTHAFPDELASAAMKKLLSEAPDVKAYLNGTLGDLLRAMDKNNIEKSLLCCIATSPIQFEPIFKWCSNIRSERIIPIPSVHPEDEKADEHIQRIADEGFVGIKMHPFYQQFWMGDEPAMRICEKANELGLMVVMHTGYDIAFPHERRADTERILKVLERFPELKLITTHMGAWQLWDEVQRDLVGKPIYIEISYALEYLSVKQAREMIMDHPQGYILFGSDSPWTDQTKTLELLRNLELPAERLENILYANAAKLLKQ